MIESVRAKLFDQFLHGTPFAPVLAGNVRFETAVRGWIGFVEGATIDWAANPRLTGEELRDLFTSVLFEILRVVLPNAIPTL